MNNNNMMVSRKGGVVNDDRMKAMQEAKRLKQEEQEFMSGFGTVNGGMMVRRDAAVAAGNNGGQAAQAMPAVSKEIADSNNNAEAPEAAEKSFAGAAPVELSTPVKANGANAVAGTSAGNSAQAKTRADIANIAGKAQAAAQSAMQQSRPAAPTARPQAPATPQAATKPSIAAPSKIRTAFKPDDIAKAYVEMFKKHFDLELSSILAYENMRRFTDVDNAKTPEKTLYYVENTYRLSTLIYLAGNFPIMVIAIILSEKNRKNILRYVTSETELAAKPYDSVRETRLSRYSKKFADMSVNDAIAITLGATVPTQELAAALKARFDDICAKMKAKYDKDLTKAARKLDDDARNDVVFIFSNIWHLLQAFENVPETRNYIMMITDDTRKNLEI